MVVKIIKPPVTPYHFMMKTQHSHRSQDEDIYSEPLYRVIFEVELSKNLIKKFNKSAKFS